MTEILSLIDAEINSFHRTNEFCVKYNKYNYDEVILEIGWVTESSDD